MNKIGRNLIVIGTVFIFFPFGAFSQKLYKMAPKVKTRWASFENVRAEKGEGGKENRGAKGHAFDQVASGETVTLLDVDGPGIINRMWMTIDDKSPEMLRSLVLKMYWDSANKPAVSVPLGDFFGVGLGQLVSFENELFSDPEGRSFNCYIPMPFKKGAKITITNDSEKDLNLLFYDINFSVPDSLDRDMLYFHAYWHRTLRTTLKRDFEILPPVEGYGRYIGTNIGVMANPDYGDSWFGEGEVKVFLDGDTNYPTLNGTGTEDYIGTGWGQGTFANKYQGSLIVDKDQHAYSFYRYHIPDPIYFHENIKVTIQQIGGAPKEKVKEYIDSGAKLIPVSTGEAPNFFKVLEQDPIPDIHSEEFPKGWTNFYREDDVSSTAYFYLDSPEDDLPSIQNVIIRTKNLPNKEKK